MSSAEGWVSSMLYVLLRMFLVAPLIILCVVAAVRLFLCTGSEVLFLVFGQRQFVGNRTCREPKVWIT